MRMPGIPSHQNLFAVYEVKALGNNSAHQHHSTQPPSLLQAVCGQVAESDLSHSLKVVPAEIDKVPAPTTLDMRQGRRQCQPLGFRLTLLICTADCVAGYEGEMNQKIQGGLPNEVPSADVAWSSPVAQMTIPGAVTVTVFPPLEKSTRLPLKSTPPTTIRGNA